ncbi:MAG: alpha/beta fold hydrolase [Rubrivivax sp.]|nr:alpha/beta fold hydrolase [Rubrivivax sp.]
MPHAPEVTHHTMADGVRVALERRGSGPVVWQMPHGLASFTHDAENPVTAPVARALSARHTLVRHELRGCGGAVAGAGTALDLDAWLGDVEQLAETIAAPTFALVGQSQGAALAIAYAARHPHRVSRLVLHGGCARGRRLREPEAAAELDMVERLAELGWDRADAAFRQVHTTQILPGARRAEQARYNDAQRSATGGATAARLLHAFETIDVSALLPQLRCPTLVLHSRDDARVPHAEGLELAAGIPGAEFVSIASPNHLLVESDPAWPRWLEAVREFLAPVQREHAQAEVSARLTARQRVLVELLAQGRCNAQIAGELGLSAKTVRNHMSELFACLAVENRGQAIVAARQVGYGLGG